MSIRITAVHMSDNGSAHEHISELAWKDYGSGATDTSSRSDLVRWISDNGKAFVESASSKVPVGVIQPAVGMPHLRTYADETWTDGLLSLPRY